MIATNHWMGAICNANHSSCIMIATNHWMGAICNAHHASCIMIATNHWMGAVSGSVFHVTGVDAIKKTPIKKKSPINILQ